MSVNLTRGGLALLLAVLALAAARADDEKKDPPKKEIKIKLPAHYATCAKACQECIKACAAAAKVCQDKYKEGEKQYAPPVRWMQDCAQTCQLNTLLIVRNGPGLKIFAEACAKMCDECARACKGFDEAELKECAKACAACAKACREMIKGPKKDEKKDDAD